jgi:hypothetical protein
VAVVGAAASAQAIGVFGGGSPSVLTPCPWPFVLMAFSPITPYGVPLIVAAFALAWCIPLLRGDGQVPRRTILFAWLVGLTSLGWFASAAVQGLNWDGPLYVAVTTGASCILALGTAVALRSARRTPSIRASALAHAILLTWFVSYAYPWFGEVP